MKNVGDIFDELGGTGAVARIIEVKHSAASEMKRRNSIPVRYWPLLVTGAQARGVELDNDVLVKVHASTVPERAA
ncbi:MAG: hypothetical protein EOS71_00410 [Mesorhizobium sp.]|nr:hypothetical protein EOA35_23645 [Mesorhizobium sp. M8A.F.Ca.ET.023.01.1.1]RWC77742.1 MAG: hypothetical protein EOS71_00410 [Mesorhizobium sp.]TIS99577.1 MAG: hypothetical protein E5W88_03260 [Mesorhizobium sp.]